MNTYHRLPESKVARFLFADSKMSIVWLPLRLYIGYIWLMAGWEKITNRDALWVGAHAGNAVTLFLTHALEKTTGVHPDVMAWYASFISHVALPHAQLFSYMVAFGEISVGIGLILGLFTGVATFFALLMNFNYLFSGTTSINPALILGELFLLHAWRVSGMIGLDRYVFRMFRK